MNGRATVHFILDGQVIAADDVAPTTTLLQYLREHLGRTGTKEGCAEGDCGACTVVEGELCDGGVQYRAVNSCIRFLPTFDGKEIVTVESLKAPDGSLHPAQQAMVDCHGSQCGFCTPGFVMSLFGLYLNQEAPRREQVLDALSGNLCRCTGYRPIIDAALAMPDYAAPARWSREEAYGPSHAGALEALQRTDSLRITAGAGFAAPRTVDELAALYAGQPSALLLAGGTDIGLWVTKLMRELPFIIYLGEVRELNAIATAADHLEIGAAVRLNEAYAALVTLYPELAELGNRFASTPIRNSGTFCGNVANGSPIGDSMPVLLALGASLVLRLGAATRELPLDEFYLGYQKKALQAGEFIAAVRIPLPHEAGGRKVVTSYKISKRFEQDISAVCAGYAFCIQDGVIGSARIAYGGMAATPQRARQTEAALLGKPWTEASFQAAAAMMGEDFQPLSDMRASAAYRLQVAANLLLRCCHEHGEAGGLPVRIPLTLSEALTE